MATRAVGRDLWLVAGFAALLLLPWLGQSALFDRDETYYAEAAREMREADSWTRPLVNGQDFFQKPFLPIAAIRASYAVLGVNETAARLPSALFGIATAVLTAALAGGLSGRAAALKAGIILPSTLLFLLVCRSALTDSSFLFFTTAAIYFLFKASRFEHSSAWTVIGMYTSAALATLSKGPMGLLIPAGVGVALTARSDFAETWRRIRRFRPGVGVVNVGVVLLLAYAASPSHTRDRFLTEFLVRENIGRFAAPRQGHTAPFWIYVPVLMLVFLPWSVFLIRAWNSAPRAARRFLGAWFAIPFLVFSAAATKLPHYLLPVFPPLAILVGASWDEQLFLRRGLLRPLVLLVVLSLALPAALLVLRYRRPDLLSSSVIVAAGSLAIGASAALLARAGAGSVFAILSGTTAVFALLLCGWSLPQLNPVRVVRPIGTLLRERVAAPTYAYRFLEPGLLFYARRTIPRLDHPEEVARVASQESALAIVARREDVTDVLRAAGRTLVVIGSRRGFCEDTGPVELVVLSAE